METTIEPTIGRDVWYVSPLEDGIKCDGIQPLTAKICFVWPDGAVNLSVHDADGNHHALISVPLFQGDHADCPPSACCWMPYQQKKAAEEAEVKE